MIMRKRYYAQKPTEIDEVIKHHKYKKVKCKPEEWKPSRHSKMLFDMNFRGWSNEH